MIFVMHAFVARENEVLDKIQTSSFNVLLISPDNNDLLKVVAMRILTDR